MNQRRSAFPIVATLLVAWPSASANAHFAWLHIDQYGSESQVLFFFGESPAERDYHLPESLAEAVVFRRAPSQEPVTLELARVESDDFIGKQTKLATADDSVVESVCRYGVYHGMLLTYYAKAIHSSSPKSWSTFAPSDQLTLEIMPQFEAGVLKCTVLWQKQPVADAKVVVVHSDGSSTDETTNSHGQVEFTVNRDDDQIGFYASRTDKTAQGTHAGEKYASATHYATLTLHLDGKSVSAGKAHEEPRPDRTVLELPRLPEPVASFGGAVLGGWLYCYSGHTGRAHSHSRENLSPYFVRTRIEGGDDWEELPMQTPLQGLALVSDAKYAYRVGGMNARNAPNEDDQLHSVGDFARYDPATSTWKSLPSLPEPRSSHDAVVIGNELYIVGGWTLDGPGHGVWLSTAWVYDLTSETGRWKMLPSPPFLRRALAVARWQGKLVAIGGMDENSEVSKSVDFFDLATRAWSSGPELPGEPGHGFGVSAWSIGDDLYVSGVSGIVYRLRNADAGWVEAARLATPRFFHRLLPLGDGNLMAVAGASFEQGHLDRTERVSITDAEMRR